MKEVRLLISAENAATVELTTGNGDRVLKCVDCGADFVFTAAEQSFFREKQFTHDPKHCKSCRAKRASGTVRVLTETRLNCDECGMETTVPFKPRRGRPVLCRACFQKLRTNARPEAPSSVTTAVMVTSAADG